MGLGACVGSIMFKLWQVLVIGLGLLSVSTAVVSQTRTGILTGQQTTGMTKQCYYSVAGNAYTHTVSASSLCPQTIQVAAPYSARPNSSSTWSAGTTTALKTGEQTTGMTKQCFYSAAGRPVTRTISAAQLCPMSIQVHL